MQRLDKSKRKSRKQDWDVDNKFKYPSNYFGKGKENGRGSGFNMCAYFAVCGVENDGIHTDKTQ